MGSISIDYAYAVPHFAGEGEAVSAGYMHAHPGGKGLNQTIALARAGASVAHAGAVGSDGARLVHMLDDEGADVRHIERRDVPTGHAITQVTPEGCRLALLYPGANHELDESLIERALGRFRENDILVLQNEVSCIEYAMIAAKAKKMRIAFNPSPMDGEVLRYPLEFVDWFVLDEAEGYCLTGQRSPEKILECLGKKYPGARAALALDDFGACCLFKGRAIRLGASEAPAVDAAAAMDAFAGYFASSLADGKGIEDALRIAAAARSIAASRHGAAPSIPALDEVLSRALKPDEAERACA